MKKTFLYTIVLAALSTMFTVTTAMAAKKIVRKGKNFIEQSSGSSIKKDNPTKTDYLYTSSNGDVDTIWVSSKGKAFVWKTSKKTGKKYRKYLPEVTEQLSK